MGVGMPTARRSSTLAAVTVAALLSLAASQPATLWSGPETGPAPSGQRQAPVPSASPPPAAPATSPAASPAAEPWPTSTPETVNLDYDVYDTTEPGVLGPDDIGVWE